MKRRLLVGVRLSIAMLALMLTVVAGPTVQAQSTNGKTAVAIFDFELIDTSLAGEIQGVQAAETERLQRLGEALRAAYASSSKYRVVDIAPVRADARSSNLQGCGDCATDLAKSLGADIAVTGTAQKVSNLILNVNVYVREVGGGRQSFSADIRGNTDESWRRGLDWLIRNRLGLGG